MKKTNDNIGTDENNNNNNDDDIDEESSESASRVAAAATAAVASRTSRMKKELDLLHREMEIAEYATAENGQYRRKVPRAVSMVRTRKRKLLEKCDATELAVHVMENKDKPKRLRGAMRALDEDVVLQSRVFQENEAPVMEEDEVDLEGETDADVALDEVEEEGEEEEEEELDADNDEEEDQEEGVETEVDSAKETGTTASDTPREKRVRRPIKRKRLVYRMRNFKSHRMAQRHGDALGAHARGQSRIAVEKLEQVAADAPTAPQVYSSLGLVYEGLLEESRVKARPLSLTEEADDETPSIEKQIELAKKAYGSYHIAALLCKKDYTLWVRSADTAIEIADLYTDAMLHPGLAYEKLEDHRQEKTKWLEEAKKAYQSADNLKPPGIDVPAKLASTHVELGNLSEALTLLTDLKNQTRAPGEDDASVDQHRHRSDFEKSYRAWLLYADLMLRIGHGCDLWNQGIQTNKNYMFRRWLRKYSETFDWKERRLQSLCLALEAAAGSASCRKLVAWAKQRAMENSKADRNSDDPDTMLWRVDAYETCAPPDGDEGKKDSVSTNNVDGEQKVAAVEASENGETLSALQAQFESEREKLISENRSELALFDAETRSMSLSSEEKKAREDFRANLTRRHRAEVVKLVGDFHQKRSQISVVNVAQKEKEPLPISASCSTVCKIASQLTKHCLGLGLFEGGQLAAEAVSSYFRERAAAHDKRLVSNEAFAQRQQSMERSVLLSFESYDDIREEGSDEDEELNYLSDDEVIDESSDPNLLQSLRAGILPPELTFLYALSLVGERKNRYLVTKCIGALLSLKEDTGKMELNDAIATDAGEDPTWPQFQRAATEPLQKMSAFAFASDLIERIGAVEGYSEILAPLFEKYLEALEDSVGLDAFLETKQNDSLASVLRKNRIVKISISASKMHLQNALTARTGQNLTIPLLLRTVNRLDIVLRSVWKGRQDREVPSAGVEILSLLERAFSLLLETIVQDDEIDHNLLKDTLSSLCGVLSYFVGVDVSDWSTSAAKSRSASWSSLPHDENWQSQEEKAISSCVYNLSIGCNVTAFSGWERDEFSLGLLRRRHGKKHFGIAVSDNRVSGYISPEMEAELASQWKQVKNALPNVVTIDFPKSLEEAKQSEWYKSIKRDTGEDESTVAYFGEKQGLALFLMYSRLCLVAEQSKAAPDGDLLVCAALSVILPITQFCLNKALWRLSAGEEVISLDGVEKWKEAAEQEEEETPPTRSFRPPVTRKPRNLLPFIKGKDRWGQRKKPNYATSIVKVPLSQLLYHWNLGVSLDESNSAVSIEDAEKAMQRVDIAMHHLRACYTEAALERGSLNVAEALLALVQLGRHCANPFLCLQQAVMFASQACKGGTSDEAFKEKLPPEKECTALEALVILGRAECLQTLRFPDEAMFLCSYIAHVCQLHREESETDLPWNPQWMVVSIYAYNVSVAIRIALCSSPTIQYTPWETSVVEELKRGRQDALAIAGLIGLEDEDSEEPDSENGNGETELAESVSAKLNDDDEDIVDESVVDADVVQAALLAGATSSDSGLFALASDQEEQTEVYEV